MSSGVFGSVRPARITPASDVEIFYYYAPSAGETSSDFSGYKTLNAADCLVRANTHEDENTIIDGLFKLRLPLDQFNRKGIYTVYIRPKEVKATIVDVSVLASYPDVKGVVFNADNIGITDLTGYRMEFGSAYTYTTRLIKSCNRCEPVMVNTADGYPKSTRYNITDGSSSFVFCTVSPSASPSFRPNASPYIGEPGVEVILANTLFSPKVFQIEMVDHDADTISYMLEGDQANDRDNAIITTYNENNEIYIQRGYYTLKDKLGNPVYTVMEKKNNIDSSQAHDNIFQ